MKCNMAAVDVDVDVDVVAAVAHACYPVSLVMSHSPHVYSMLQGTLHG